jgi:hypothetical protein
MDDTLFFVVFFCERPEKEISNNLKFKGDDSDNTIKPM